MQNFENPHDCGQRRTHKVQKRRQEPFDARCRRCEVFSERRDAFCHDILLSKIVIFDGNRKEFSMNRGAFLVRKTRPAPAQASLKAQESMQWRQMCLE